MIDVGLRKRDGGPPVDAQDGAGHRAGRCQEHDRIGYVLGRDHPLQRNALDDGLRGVPDLLEPAVVLCAKEGILVSGPHSADSLYFRAHTGEFDVVIAPYHDQGLIPVKLIAHGESANVTLGLPYVRTSPDHGTAFSIAGKGEADPSGMEAALKCALDLVQRRGLQWLHKP